MVEWASYIKPSFSNDKPRLLRDCSSQRTIGEFAVFLLQLRPGLRLLRLPYLGKASIYRAKTGCVIAAYGI